MQQFHKFIKLTFMCGSSCFGRLPAHHQEYTTALGASGLTASLQRLSQRLLVQLYAPDDKRGDARNMLSHT
jgi:hypothetical protein